MSIVCTIAVGEKYNQELVENIKRFDVDLWDIHILTDQPELYPEYKNVFKYENKIFSYFDKLLFVARTVRNKGKGVVWVDADKIFLLSDQFLMYNHDYDYMTIYSRNRWHPYFIDDHFTGGWSIVRDYFKYLAVDYRSIPNIWEEVWYLNHDDNIDKIILDLETLKPLFDYRSIIDEFPRNGYGDQEGVALGYIAHKYGRELKYFSCDVFPNNDPFADPRTHVIETDKSKIEK